MKFLLDTHTFLWWISDDGQLSDGAKKVIQNPENELFLSAASAWEIAIKTNLGRLTLPASPSVFIPEQLSLNAVMSLQIEISHALQIASLPAHHRDPFDRMLVAQAQLEEMPLITADSQIARYEVEILW
jgi:PIN domain nuclease of toxin-antitoxin system